jgi:hypothetical protein
MPGWYIHSEVARLTALQLSDATNLPAELGFDPTQAQKWGDICHRWRNFLAIGAVGPDMFYLLPDYAGPPGNMVLSFFTQLIKVWGILDEQFIGSWEKWMGPVTANEADLINLFNGGFSNQIAQGIDEINSALLNVELTLVTRATDWFGKLTSGVPQGFTDDSFYWSDMFHYRKTYAYPQELWRRASDDLIAVEDMENALGAAGHVLTPDEQQTVDDERAKAESELAFAIGWMTHCATDVTGHPFTNAKCGGPFRLQWQRHHLVENHFDALAYDKTHHGMPTYEEMGTSGLHFRVAFREKSSAPYNGCRFAPMFDYFTDFPSYPLGETNADDETRTRFFDCHPHEFPVHLVTLIVQSMETVYYQPHPLLGPRLLESAPQFNDGGMGRPNGDALKVMWQAFFEYWKIISTSGLHPRKPMAPSFTSDLSPPLPPGGALPPEDDARGADPADDAGMNGSFNLFDALIAILAWLLYLAELVEYLLALVPAIVLGPLTLGPRELLFNTVVSPLYSAYMASRKVLVLSGFLTPKPEEIDDGFVTLGHSSSFQRMLLKADVNDTLGFALPIPGFDEPSGRVPGSEWDADPAFPRQSVRDTLPEVDQFRALFGLPARPVAPGEGEFSQWVAPWKYPQVNLAGQRVGWEAGLTHVGPWKQGATAADLLDSSPTNLAAAARFEQADTPKKTADECAAMLRQDQHMGNPVDYSLYLISKLTKAKTTLPDFNLDSDRGYAWHCWDYDRHIAPAPPTPAPAKGSIDDFSAVRTTGVLGVPIPQLPFQQPCTPPEQFKPEWAANQTSEREPWNKFQARRDLSVYYLDENAPSQPCGLLPPPLPEMPGEAPPPMLMNAGDSGPLRAHMMPDGLDQ